MTALGKTASITLLTAIPGSGKTLRLVGFIKAANAAGEQVFVTNINGLKLPHIPFADPREWADLPRGSVLVIDEAQNWFRARRSGDPPKYLTDMETIRHAGIRLILATQQPNYLDTHLRGLVGLHEHLVRVQGEQAATIYRKDEVITDVQSGKGRAAADSEKWTFPQEDFALYESAQIHTVKKVMSSRKKRGIIIALIAGGVLAAAGVNFARSVPDTGKSGDLEHGEAEGGSAVLAPRTPRAAEVTALEKHKPDSLAEWLANLTPRVDTLPWSAPIYDDQKPVAAPRVFCMKSGAGLDASGKHAPASVKCHTEQGTLVLMEPKRAAMLALQGEPYNPYKEPERMDKRERGAGVSPAETGASGAAPALVMAIEGEAMNAPTREAMQLE
jgi:hypothetical protein